MPTKLGIHAFLVVVNKAMDAEPSPGMTRYIGPRASFIAAWSR
jgi:hypothetical protein